jgi:hypothetical protein
MTTYYKEIKQCSVCGAENEYTGIGSTGAFGPQDLDTRPPERKRSTIIAWVQRCPDCGYCAADVSETCCPEAREIVNSREYKERLNDPTCPELANSLLCKAIIDRKSRALAAATLSFMWAAWSCDDSGHFDQARECRQKAAEMLVIAEDDGQQVFKREGANTAILVDLLRRTRTKSNSGTTRWNYRRSYCSYSGLPNYSARQKRCVLSHQRRGPWRKKLRRLKWWTTQI